MKSRFHRWEMNARGPSESAQAIRFSELAARNPVVERPPRNIEPFSRFLYPDDLTIQYLIDCFSHGLKSFQVLPLQLSPGPRDAASCCRSGGSSNHWSPHHLEQEQCHEEKLRYLGFSPASVRNAWRSTAKFLRVIQTAVRFCDRRWTERRHYRSRCQARSDD